MAHTPNGVYAYQSILDFQRLGYCLLLVTQLNSQWLGAQFHLLGGLIGSRNQS